MPWKNAQDRNRYFRERYKERMTRAHKILGGVCCKCGSTDRLEIDHIDPNKKVLGSNGLAMASEERFLRELEKCQLLCKPCHIKKTSSEYDASNAPRGEKHGRARLTKPDILEIRKLADKGFTHQYIAEKFSVSRSHITKIVNKTKWGHV